MLHVQRLGLHVEELAPGCEAAEWPTDSSRGGAVGDDDVDLASASSRRSSSSTRHVQLDHATSRRTR